MDKFLAERYLSLKVTEDCHPGMETQAHSRESLPMSESSKGNPNPFRSEGSPVARRVHSFGTTVDPKRRTCGLCFKENHPIRIIKLPFRLTQAQGSGLNQTISAQSKKLCHFSIRSPTKPGLHLDATAYVLPELSGSLPSHPIPEQSLRDLPNLPWANPTFYESSQIDDLIGADILPSILLIGSQTNICGSLLGQETIFGWVLTGPLLNTIQGRVASFSTQVSTELETPLDQLLTKFWEVEDIPTKIVRHESSTELSTRQVRSLLTTNAASEESGFTSSPHFGGLWESAVKVAKQLLVKCTNSTALNYEGLATAITQVEAVMNSRPLHALSSDPNDFEALTPGHFLVGRPLNELVEPVDDALLKLSMSNHWKRILMVHHMFWHRWSSEYLTLLQKRTKWNTVANNIQLGTLVLIAEDNAPPGQWLLGRVAELHPGTDGAVRIVTLRTKTGLFKRNVHKLCPLPTDDDELNVGRSFQGGENVDAP
ncbi:GL15636 [Drosophila persimilis]|uniref:GL15636 n=1 Tax=Drosophila persimilis TaxID=7234 RepID=B4HCL7_DROPE|nr:GL15636 [Drosophila persimilis]